MKHLWASARATQISCVSCFHASSQNKPYPLLKHLGAATALRALLTDIMLQFLLRFAFGNLVGMYLVQNCVRHTKPG